MDKDKYKDTIRVALNALAVLEADNPEDGRRYRRMLPSLAAHFARAGNPLSESGILKLVAEARERNIPLSDFFNTAPKKSRKELNYDAIAARLNRIPPSQQMTPDLALKTGDLESFKDFDGNLIFTDEEYRQYANNAAIKGHTDLCLYLAKRTPSPDDTLARSLISAVRKKQYHFVYRFLKDDILKTGDPEETIRSALEEGLRPEKEEKYQEFLAFRKMFFDFQKSSPHVRAEHFTGLEAFPDVPLKLRPYLEIRDVLKAEITNVRDLNKAAFKAAMVFQSRPNLLRYFDRWGTEASSKPLKELLNGIDAPVDKSIDWPSWADALIKYGPQMNYATHHAAQLLTPVRNGGGRISLRLTMDRIWNDYFPQGKKFGQIDELGFRHRAEEFVLKACMQLWEKAAKKDPEKTKAVPGMEIDGNEFGLPGYRLMKMPHTDPRILFIGDYTGCCEKMGGQYESTVFDAVRRRTSGFYILAKGNEIKAHSWVWRGEGGQLVIDGWESKDRSITKNILFSLTNLIGERLSSYRYRKYGISDVLLGRCGNNLRFDSRLPEARKIARRYLCTKYYQDGGPNQWLVRRIREPEKYLLYNPAKYDRPLSCG